MLNWIKQQYEEAKPFLIGAILIATHAAFMYGGADIATRNADRERDSAVQAAIANMPEPSLNCKERDLMDAIRNLAENGAHLEGYEMSIKFDNRQVKP